MRYARVALSVHLDCVYLHHHSVAPSVELLLQCMFITLTASTTIETDFVQLSDTLQLAIYDAPLWEISFATILKLQKRTFSGWSLRAQSHFQTFIFDDMTFKLEDAAVVGANSKI